MVAAIAGAAGNILCVIAVVVLGSRIRERALARRGATPADDLPAVAPPHEARAGTVFHDDASGAASIRTLEQPAADDEVRASNARPTRREKGRARVRRWMVRFGVPGASLLAPLALPTMPTAAFFVAAGVPKKWVIPWQAIAIILWTGAVSLAATGVLALLGG
ncbi:small multidrug efflux protein [Kocuria sp. NPDC057446]|uniref:small multidrug efflux protein n=1 Tax=Kocuria sp. NPDC057446 TaxID=3346137 RepID=UPI0036CECEBE